MNARAIPGEFTSKLDLKDTSWVPRKEANLGVKAREGGSSTPITFYLWGSVKSLSVYLHTSPLVQSAVTGSTLPSESAY